MMAGPSMNEVPVEVKEIKMTANDKKIISAAKHSFGC